MAKKGFFSWFRKDKKPAPEVTETPQDTQAQIDAETAQAEQQAAKAAEEAERLLAEQKLAEQKRAEQQAAEQALAEQQAAEEAARQLAEQQAREQAEREQQEQARLLSEQKLAEKALAEQQAAEKALAEQQAAEEAARQLAEQQAREQAEREQQQQARLLAEQKLAEQKLAEQQAAEQALAEQQAAEEAARQLAEQQAAEEAARQLAEQQALEQAEHEQQVAADVVKQPEPQAKPKKEGMFARLKRGLMRTSENIGSGFMSIFKGKKIDDDLFEELEEQLLIADVGVETTTKLINNLTDQASRKQLKDAEALYDLMREEMQKTLEPVAIPLVPENNDGPFVILMVGVNGVGKTTTIGKLAKQYQNQGKSVMLAAGDTFRAAAVEQLQVWGERNDIPVVAQHTGADSASVLFDALQAAKSRNVDVLIADTAGRLQNKGHLMEELKKVVRVMQKLDPSAPHEVMLTLDASTGQNAISQAQLFQEAVGVTGITISKLDGTAKGGVIFAIADKFNIPIRHIGVGEQIDDLRTFDAGDFIEALFNQEKT